MRHLKPKITRRVYPSGKISFCVDAGIVNKKRQRKFYPTKDAAQKYADQLQQARVKNGESVFSLNSQQQLEAVRCFERLKTSDTSLTEAIDFYLLRNKPKNGKKLVSDVTAEFLKSRNQANFKPRYLKALRIAFGKFTGTFGTRFIHEITKAEIEEWLNNRTVSKNNTAKLSPLTKRNYLRDIGMLFKFAGEEGYCAENVIKRIKRPLLIDKPAEIFSVPQAVLILSAANQTEKSLVPYLAIGFFAGLRSSELETLDWNEINLHGKKIEVKAEKAKTSRRRFVEMSENLCAWLKPREKTEGLIVSPGWRDRLQKLFKSAKEPKHEFDFDAWPRNGLRHSFGSYHYALYQDANKTASQMGHENTKMLFAHYRELVSAEQAELYWNIYPPENGWLMISPQSKKRKISAKDIQAVNRVMQRLQKTQLAEFQ